MASVVHIPMNNPHDPAAYLLVDIVAIVLSGANVVGYVKCSKQASKQLKDMATAAVTTGFTVCPCLFHVHAVMRPNRYTYVCCRAAVKLPGGCETD